MSVLPLDAADEDAHEPAGRRRGARESAGFGAAGAAQPSATGCPFVPRRPLASDACSEQRPPLRPVDSTPTACHHAEHVCAP